MLDKIKFDGLADDVIAAIKTPEPDFYMPMASSLNIDKGIGTNVFTRSSTATYIDEYGELKTAEIDEPRLQKDGYLMELQGENLNPLSEISNTDGVGCAVSESSTTLLSDSFKTFTINSVSGEIFKDACRIDKGSLSDGETYTFSLFIDLQNTSCKDVSLRFADGARGSVHFNLETLSVSSESGSITKVNDSIYRIAFYANYSEHSAGLLCRVQQYNPVLGETFSICGAQVEKSHYASSYIPTNGTPVTRAADILNLSKLAWVKKDYTMSYELSVGKLPTIGYADIISVQGVTFNLHRISAQGIAYYVDGGGLIGDITNNSSNKAVTTYDSNKTQSLTVNGVQSSKSNINLSNDTSITGMQIRLHAKVGYNGSPYIHLKNLKIWREALTDEQARGIN